MDFTNFWLKNAPSVPPGIFGDSLRFRGTGSNAYLARTPSSGGSRTTHTVSFWFKNSTCQNRMALYSAQRTHFSWDGDNELSQRGRLNGNLGAHDPATNIFYNSIGRFRDPGAWYHYCAALDSTNPNENDRFRLYINGKRVSTTGDSLPQNYQSGWNCAGIDHRIGDYADPSDYNFNTDGVMAEFYSVDGQALSPDIWGEYSDEGVWVAKSNPNLNSADYGVNGFYLDFSDPFDLGADRSGNNNHWTQSGGFVTANMIGAEVFYETPKSFDSDANEAVSYGSIPVQVPDLPSGSTCLFKLTTPVTSVTVKNSNSGGGNFCTGEISLTGEAGTWRNFVTNGGWSGGDASGEIIGDGQPFQYVRIGFASGFALFNISEPSGAPNPLFDLLDDTPDKNAATLNKKFTNGQANPGILGDANLGFTADINYSTAPSTQSIKDGKYYWEAYYITADGTNSSMTGIVRGTTGADNIYISYDPNGNVFGLGYNSIGTIHGDAGNGGIGSTSGASIQSVDGFNPGDVISVASDIPNGVVEVYKNNNVIYQFNNVGAGDIYDWMAAVSAYNGGQWNVNFGQQPFLYEPPAGYKALNSENAEEVPILNGRDHFRAITGPGQGASTGGADTTSGPWSKYVYRRNDFTSTSGISNIANAFDNDTSTSMSSTTGVHMMFAPSGDDVIDFETSIEVWLNGPPGVPWHWYDNGFNNESTTPGSATTGQWVQIGVGPGQINSTAFIAGGASGTGATLGGIRVDGKVLVDQGILDQAQQIFPEGFYWIKDRDNVANHQLVDTVRGSNVQTVCPTLQADTTYNAPSGNCVAYCWKAGPNETNNDGTVQTTVAANKLAGFSIVSWQGNNQSDATWGHGLDKAPQFTTVKCITDSFPFETACQDFFIRMQLNTNALDDSGDTWTVTTTDKLIIPTAKSSTMGHWNGVGQTYISYNWHEVPGYSKMGKYKGHSATGGDYNGPFVYCGFRPAFLLLKTINQNGNWQIIDTARNEFNPCSLYFRTNSSDPEQTYNPIGLDIYSNGFKIRQGGIDLGGDSTGEFFFMAFAENPHSLPCNAR